MYPVSEDFQEEIRNPFRQERIQGYLTFKTDNGYFSHYIGEDAIIQKSLSIVDQLPGGKFGYGGVYIKYLDVKIDTSKIADLDPVNINLSGASIRFTYYLKIDEDTEEQVLMGDFLVDATKSSRKENILIIRGISRLSLLDIPSVSLSYVTPYEIAATACSLAGATLENTEDFFQSLPNGNMTLSYDTDQIQTARDMVMWVAKLTGTIVKWSDIVGESGVKFVQIPKKYTKSGTSGNFDLDTFKSDNGSVLDPNFRISTEFTDTSIRITTLVVNIGNDQLSSRNEGWTFASDTLIGTMEIEKNPLLNGKSVGEIQTVLDNLRNYTDDLRFCPFKTTYFGNPAIEVGDFVYLQPGGNVDETNYRHYGIVTYCKYVYGGKCEIRCATDLTAERPETAETASVLSVNGMTRATAPTYGTQAKSQVEKRLDALEGRSGDSLVSSNGSKLSLVPSAYSPASLTQPNQLIVSVSDAGALETRSINSHLNAFPGNTYLEQRMGDGSTITTTISATYIKYERRDANGTFGGNADLYIEALNNGFAISNNGQVLKVTDGNLYINGTQIT